MSETLGLATDDARSPTDGQQQGLHTLLALARWHDVLQQASTLRAAGDVEAWVCHLGALAGLDDWAALRRDAPRALALAPQEPRIHLLAAQADSALGLYGPAEVRLRRLVDMAPEWAPAWRQLARVQLLRDEPEAACNTLSRALALDADEPAGHLLQAAVWVRQGRWADAQQAVDAALWLAPDDANALAMAAQLARRRSRRKALELMRRTLRAAPADAGHRHRYQQLRRIWWFDALLATGVVLALLLDARAWLGSWGFTLSATAFMLIAGRLQRHGQPSLLAAFCAGVSLVCVLDTPGSLPDHWRQGGWTAISAGDMLAFVLGNAAISFGLFVLAVLTYEVYWHGLKQALETAAGLWRAARSGLLPEHGIELLARPGARANLLVGLGAIVPALPPLSLAMYSAYAVFLLPVWVWGCGRVLRRSTTRVAPWLAFALIGFPLMLATVIAFGWVGDSAARQVLLALVFGGYAMIVNHRVQSL